MMNVAFIPVRGGSKSIPLKNIKEICGKPLVYWSAKAACLSENIDKVYIATDSEDIRNSVEKFVVDSKIFNKLEVIGRSSESANDTASTEFAMLEFAEKYDFENIILIQATSPLIKCEDIDGGFELFNQDTTDSVLSVVREYRFIWNEVNGNVISENYDVYNRPRRQDFKGFLMENGAFYITTKNALIKTKNRISGNIKGYEMCADSAFEIDEPSDWIVVENLMKKNGFDKKLIPEIKMFLTDCDGCLTDGGMYYSEHGDELKKFNTRDGMGFALLRKKNIITGIVTSENVDLNRRRAEKMKLDILESGCTDKLGYVTDLCNKNNLELENVAYIGDDINDIELLKKVGFSACPADAMPQVKSVVKYVAQTCGGKGVIREVVELLEKK